MSVTLKATAGASDANSYLTTAEATAYFDTRLPVPEWVASSVAQQEVLLMMATRLMDATLTPFRRYMPPEESRGAYYLTRRAWTGAPATTTQALAWPRTGMYNRNGVAIASNVIPQELKEATAELAAQLAKNDLTENDDVAVQGITALRAGSVSLNFSRGAGSGGEGATGMLPDMVLFLLVPSWLSREVYEDAAPFEFEVL